MFDSTVKIDGSIKLAQGGDWRPRDSSPMPVTLAGSNAVTIGDKIVIFGGVENSTVQNKTWIYNITLDRWTQMQPADSPPPRKNAAFAVSPNDDQLVLFGGTPSENVPAGEELVLNDTWIYDVGDNRWTLIDETNHPSGRCGDMFTIWGTSKAVLIGGEGEYVSENHSQPRPMQCNDTWVFDFDSHRWTQIYPDNEPLRSYDFAAVMTSVPFTDKVVQYMPWVDNCTRIFDLSDNKWTIPTSTNRPEINNALAISGVGSTGTVLLVGRIQGTSPDNTSTYLFNINDANWTQPVTTREPSGSGGYPVLLPLLNTNLAIQTRSRWQDMWVFDLAAYTHCGEYRSPYVDARGADLLSIGWNATVPANTSMWFRIRTAGSISEIVNETFAGPNGIQGAQYDAPGPLVLNPDNVRDRFVQYMARFETRSQNITPVLDSVVIGSDFPPGTPEPQIPTAQMWINDSAPIFEWLFNDTDSTQGAYEWQMRDRVNGTASLEYSETIVSAENRYSRNRSRWFNDGPWYWRVRTMDAEDLWGPFSEYVQFGIDTAKPQPVRISAAPAGWTNGPVEIKFEADDALSGIDRYSVEVDGVGVGNLASPFNFAGFPDGVHNITVRAYDKAGNSEAKTAVARIDTEPPEPFSPQMAPQNWSNTDPTMVFATQDRTSGVDYYTIQIDGSAPQVRQSPAILRDMENGNHTIIVSAYDKAGNGRNATVYARLDKSAPVDLAVSGIPGGWVNRSPTISISAFDADSGVDHFERSLNGGPFSPCTPTTTIVGLRDGVNHIEIKGLDAAGNSAQTAFEVRFDSSPPHEFFPVASPPNWTNSSPVIAFETSDDLSGIHRYLMSVDGGRFNVSRSPATLGPLTDGPHEVGIRAVDNAGNSIEGSVTVYIDRTPPSQLALKIKNGKSVSSRQIHLLLTACDNASGIWQMCISNDGIAYNPWEPFRATKSWLLTEGSGEKTVYVRVRDQAGNEIGPATAVTAYQPESATVPQTVLDTLLISMIVVLALIYLKRSMQKKERR